MDWLLGLQRPKLHRHYVCFSDPGPPGYLKASTVWKFWCPPGDDKTVTPRYGLGFELTPDEQFYGMCGRYTFGAGHTGKEMQRFIIDKLSS